MEEEKDQIEIIKDKVNQIVDCVNPHVLADLRLELASRKVWIGTQLIEYEMAYNIAINKEMKEDDLPATKAEIRVKAQDVYRNYAIIKQLYNDVKTVISAAASKLKVLEDERYTQHQS